MRCPPQRLSACLGDRYTSEAQNELEKERRPEVAGCTKTAFCAITTSRNGLVHDVFDRIMAGRPFPNQM